MGTARGFYALHLLIFFFSNLFINIKVKKRSGLRNKLVFGLEKKCTAKNQFFFFFIILWEILSIPLIVGILLKSVLKQFLVPSQKVGATVN